MSGSNAVDAVLQNVIGMPRDRQFCKRVATLGLNVVNVMWEDTARTPGSVWGDNISDMTLMLSPYVVLPLTQTPRSSVPCQGGKL